MCRPELLEALSTLEPEVEVPIPGVSKPPGKLNFISLKRLVKNASDAVMTEVNKFEEWVLSKIPELSKNRSNKKVRKRLNRKVKELKKKIKDSFDVAIKFTPKEEEAALKGYLKTYMVGGEKGIDPIRCSSLKSNLKSSSL